ncbi:MAG: hypothetical protein Ct9H300mP2_3840 [Candidatus Neomarinimicrobiota bacterium]|nr:MAG: hypothetical protein Ct9H300mP2_3840 [Candidatus Neomarinimicrobiota bacterium]
MDGVLEWGKHAEGRLKMSNFDAGNDNTIL